MTAIEPDLIIFSDACLTGWGGGRVDESRGGFSLPAPSGRERLYAQPSSVLENQLSLDSIDRPSCLSLESSAGVLNRQPTR